MKRKVFLALLAILAITSLTYCLDEAKKQKEEYGVLKTAVSFASDKVIGEYGDSIPPDFTAEKFMEFLKNRIPEEHYKALKKYSLELKPKGSYYLLLIYNPKTKDLILFDYSCTPEADGPVLEQPNKYDINKLELYDTCK